MYRVRRRSSTICFCIRLFYWTRSWKYHGGPREQPTLGRDRRQKTGKPQRAQQREKSKWHFWGEYHRGPDVPNQPEEREAEEREGIWQGREFFSSAGKLDLFCGGL
ncbi:hypothetical protein CCUS01_16731 [Colletotrichum cuscutae]|uniref:Uncharacterized protein n=1 Tax=Colletotrichum cuscutae TaxID=1209917 RepID=A0AAI9V8E1_9PEZI|nr:hypothetical protein CCUS01_16731 [Colletotrichum cuscutae]